MLLVRIPAEWVWLVVLLELAALIGGAVYRATTKKKPMLRFEAYSGELVLPESNPLFFASVSETLAAAETWRQSAAPPPEVLASSGASSEQAQPQWQPYAGLPPLWTPQPPAASPQSTYAAPPPDWQSPPPPPPDYSAPSSQIAENPPSPSPSVDNADATGENDRR
jgi:hypothetical protein